MSKLHITNSDGFTFNDYFVRLFQNEYPRSFIASQDDPDGSVHISLRYASHYRDDQIILELTGNGLGIKSNGTVAGLVENITFHRDVLGQMAELSGIRVYANDIYKALESMIGAPSYQRFAILALLYDGITQTDYTNRGDSAAIDYLSDATSYNLRAGNDSLNALLGATQKIFADGGDGADTVHFSYGPGWGRQRRVDVTITEESVIVHQDANLVLSDFESLSLHGTTSLIRGSSEANAISVSSVDGRHTVFGGAGDDFLSAGQGKSTLSGGSGDDRIEVGYGLTTIHGGAGVDLLHIGYGVEPYHLRPVRVDLEAGTLDFVTRRAVQFDGIEDFSTEGSRSYHITGSDRANSIQGGSGADKITGGSGADIIDGQWGNDVLAGGAGADTIVIKSRRLGGWEDPTFGNDTILDFDLTQDRISLSLNRMFDTIEEVMPTMRVYRDGIAFDFGGFGEIALVGLTAQQAADINFQFE